MKTAVSVVGSILLLGLLVASMLAGVAVWVTLRNPAELAGAVDGQDAAAVLWEIGRIVVVAVLQIAGYL